MSLTSIETLITQEGWNLQSWGAKYGSGGVWLVVSPKADDLDQIRKIANGSEIEAAELDRYFHDQGSWLPLIRAVNISEGLSLLEQKIAPYFENEKWKTGVLYAFERLIEVSDGNHGLKNAVEQESERIFFKPRGV